METNTEGTPQYSLYPNFNVTGKVTGTLGGSFSNEFEIPDLKPDTWYFVRVAAKVWCDDGSR